ncbi:S-layer homology domain-containing protein [Paenibacillus sp. MBLB2552]|uniref:S-layer homology domain-containing protein n=1 Tax=Paenibacillus mellifer TaxID=2937794 RepID=A0A9X2BQW1_9BACL|nr:S-layer homology domain-containing protein [Paenibacillus mellifer]MCK8486635.1 S-layer homology domain-containing protein [Paenibacillus mellifer]
MNILRDELIRTNDGYELLIYLDPQRVEFANESDSHHNHSEELYSDVQEYAKKKYPNVRINVAKIILGGMLISTVPLTGFAGQAHAASPNDYASAAEWAKPAISRLMDKNIITGDPAGNFNPKSAMNRDAFTTMLVKALVPATELVTPATATFTDINKDHWAYTYVETAVAKGWITGISANSFGGTQDVTREQMASIFVRALGLSADDIRGLGDTLTFEDKNDISPYARDAVAFAVTNGLFEGITPTRFEGRTNASREQVAVVVDRYLTNKDKLQDAAAALLSTTVTASVGENLSTVTLTFSREIDSLTASDISIKAASGAILGIKNVSLSDDKKSAVLTTDKMTGGVPYTITVNKPTVKAPATVTPVVTDLLVTDVSADNNKQIRVTFNQELDRSSALLASNYTYTGASSGITSVDLLDDQKSVLVTLAQAEGQQAVGTLAIKNLQSVAGNKLANYSKTVTFLDLTVPSAVGAKLVAPTKVQVTFSEPVTAATLSNAAFSLNNNTYSLAGAPTIVRPNVVELTLGSALPIGDYTLTINPAKTASGNQMKDFVGLAVPTSDIPFSYAPDTTAPVASIAAITQTSVTIQFDEPVSLAGTGTLNNDFSVYHSNNNVAAYRGTASLSPDGLTMTVNFDQAPLPQGNVTLFLNNSPTTASQLQDAWGNKFVSTTLSSSVIADTIPPTVAGVNYVDSTHIDVTFSEAVTGVDTADFTLKAADGSTVSVTNIAPTSNTYRLTTATPINGSTYTLSLAEGVFTDTSLARNKNAAYSTSFNVDDTIAPTTTTGTYTADKKTVLVKFSEAMTITGLGSVLDTNYYRFAAEDGSNPSALPAGTTITPTDGYKGVLITLPSAISNLGSGNFAKILVGQVKDAAGNSTSALSNPLPLTAASLTVGNLSDVRAISRDTITFKVDSYLNAIDVTKFTIDGQPAASATYKNEAGVALVTVKAPSIVVNPSTVVLDIAAGGLISDLNISSDAITQTGSIDYAAPAIVSRVIADTNGNDKFDTVTVTFSEPIQATSVAFDSFLVGGYTIDDVTVSADGTKVLLKLQEKERADISSPKPTVQLVKSIRDASPQRNVIAPETAGVAATTP